MELTKTLEVELGKLSLQDNDVVVIKFDTHKWSADILSKFMSAIKDISPNPVIAIPGGMEIDTDYVDKVIQYLEDMKKS